MISDALRTRSALFLAFVLMAALGRPPATLAADPAAQTPPSEWIEAEKKIYRDLLRGAAPAEVLVVPFEVDGASVDRIGRTLMARYLAEQLRIRADAEVPSLTLVARALGQDARRYDDDEVCRLANDLKAKLLIRGLVAHDMGERLKVSVSVQVRDGDAPFSPQMKADRMELSGLPFSDEKPPEEVFRLAVGQVISWLPVESKPERPRLVYPAAPPDALPATLAEICSARDLSPVVAARRLQLLGALLPGDTTARQHLFERSLVALDAVAPESPDYPILKATALYRLHRRPAAVAALASLRTPEERFLAARLDGDLPGVEKALSAIEGPVPRLLAEIEASDLSLEYDAEVGDRTNGPADLPAGWKAAVARRMGAPDQWEVEPNLLVKKELDAAFPVDGPTADTLAASRLARGESLDEGEEIDLAPYRHWRRLLTGPDAKRFAADAAAPTPLDHLDLLAAFAEFNLVKLVELRSRVQDLPDEALALLDLYDATYRGHPEFEYWRARTLNDAASKRLPEAREKLRAEAKARAVDAFRWAQGQTSVSRRAHELADHKTPDGKPLAEYDHDYPRRPYWNISREGDRRVLRPDAFTGSNAEEVRLSGPAARILTTLNLLYDETPFGAVKLLYEQIGAKAGAEAADRFLAANPRRLRGHPQLPGFKAGIELKKGGVPAAEAVYRAAIAEAPLVWRPYDGYGAILMERGELKQAAELYLSYPPFRHPETVRSGYAVTLSHRAKGVGLSLWLRGAVDQAAPFFRIAAQTDTGSGADFYSKAKLAEMEGDYRGAAKWYLTFAKRYDNAMAYGHYIELLHCLGQGKLAWSLFDATVARVNWPNVWVSAQVGLRVEGKSPDEVSAWFSRPDVNQAAQKARGYGIVATYLVDRAPEPRVVDWLRAAGPPLAPLAAFAKFYGLFRAGKFAEAADPYDSDLGTVRREKGLFEALLPILVRADIKISARTKAEEAIAAPCNSSASFYLCLCRAELLGTEGRHVEAEAELKKALYQMPDAEPAPFTNWYLLVDTAEWLYGETKEERYRKLTVEWAKVHEQMLPTQAWAYAIEARHTDNAGDRRRALALTLYLDRSSERIADIPKEEKDLARQWLEDNNPFLQQKAPKPPVADL